MLLDFLADAQVAAYGRPPRTEPERFVFLDDAGKRLIADRRGDHSRRWIILPTTTVRYLGVPGGLPGRAVGAGGSTSPNTGLLAADRGPLCPAVTITIVRKRPVPLRSNFDEQFRDLIDDRTALYESRLAESQGEFRIAVDAINRRRGIESRDRLAGIGLDIQALERAESLYDDELRPHLNRLREGLAGRPANPHRWKLTTDRDSVTAPLYGASVLAPHANLLSHIPGERGNPWVLPDDPSRIRIANSVEGGGIGFCDGARPAGSDKPVQANLLWRFTPDTSGWWNLTAIVTLQGFYIVTAQKDWWNCKQASIKLDAWMSVYQYDWHPVKKFPLLDRTANDSYQSGIWDSYLEGGGLFDARVQLQAGDSVWVWVAIILAVDCYGRGSRAEINFRDGNNFIEPSIVSASPPS